MTEAIVTTSRTATELMSTSAETELRSMVHKIMRLTSGGRKLNQTQAAELESSTGAKPWIRSIPGLQKIVAQ